MKKRKEESKRNSRVLFLVPIFFGIFLLAGCATISDQAEDISVPEQYVPEVEPIAPLPTPPPTPTPLPTPELVAVPTPAAAPSAPSSKIVNILTSGDPVDILDPRILEIKVGDSVTWVNKDTLLHWIASDDHPTHRAYPETGGCIGSKFDSCVGLRQGENYTFTFNTFGEWGYHDHIHPDVKGKIIVIRN